jgi:hypothetical protein
MAAGRPPRAYTLRPAEARDLQPERCAEEPSLLSPSIHPAEAERGVDVNGLSWTHKTANVTTENAFVPLASLAAHSFTFSSASGAAYTLHTTVGRRGRQRERQAHPGPATAPMRPALGSPGKPARDRMARVQVSDEIWSAFRAGLGATPASVALGRLVEREVASRRRRASLDAEAVHAAIGEGRLVAEELAALISRLETL